jgi:hypothetical protein
MQTEIIKIDPHNIDKNKIIKAAKLIADGEDICRKGQTV